MLKKVLAVAAILAILGTPVFALDQAMDAKQGADHAAGAAAPGMTGSSNSLGFALAIGLAIYFPFGRKRSALAG